MTRKSPASAYMTGQDASEFDRKVNGTSSDDIEAVLVNKDNTVWFFYHHAGYVTLDDWGDVDADKFIAEIKSNTEESNIERRKAGISAVHVTGWIRQPTLDRASQTISWSIAANDERDGPMANSVVLALNRGGYERFVWVGEQNESQDLLAQTREAFFFPEGQKYTDHLPTDKIAAVGAAGLVASLLGVKAVKIGALAGLAVLLKKFAALLILPFVLLWRWVKGLFGRRSEPAPIAERRRCKV